MLRPSMLAQRDREVCSSVEVPRHECRVEAIGESDRPRSGDGEALRERAIVRAAARAQPLGEGVAQKETALDAAFRIAQTDESESREFELRAVAQDDRHD